MDDDDLKAGAFAGPDEEFDDLVCEVSEQLEAGEYVDLERLATRYPERIEQLRQVLPTLQAMAELGHADTDPTLVGQPSGEPSSGPLRELGDFRIVREVGRGGMGVVYEAEQVSLGRRVALKVLPFAAVLDQRQLERFTREAKAAGSVHHQNIVPVYSVGCERGVHFYAMQFVDGQTLAELIGQLREASGLGPDGQTATTKTARKTGPLAPLPNATTLTLPEMATTASTTQPAFFRSVAQLGIQVAEALDHAHQQGVVHRDIKPSNLMVDARGKPWITDFGLAHIETGPSLTVSGDLLGTLRYMSPEQAMAKRIIIDHRSDIYSLGITLYELLTLRPAFDGSNRRELLSQIAFEEPRPPRKLNRAIPADLETILLKAIAKNPAERYATAQELADDLHRFLDLKPIRAKRPTVLQRAAKWARRHAPLVWSAAALLILTTAASLIAAKLVWNERQKLRHTNVELREARDEAKRQASLARKEGERALAHASNLVKAASQLAMSRQGHLRALRELNRLEEAEPVMREAIKLGEYFVAVEPHEPRHRLNLALLKREFGLLLKDMVRPDKAETESREAAAMLAELLEGDGPGWLSPGNLAELHVFLGQLLVETARPKEAERRFRKAMALCASIGPGQGEAAMCRELLASTQLSLGRLLRSENRRDEGERTLRQSVASYAKLAEGRPDDLSLRIALADSRHDLGALLKDLGRREEAETELREAAVMLAKAAEEEGAGWGPRDHLAAVRVDLGQLLVQAGQPKEAERQFREAVGLYAAFLHGRGERARFREYLGWSQHHLGRLLSDTGRGEEAVQTLRQAIASYAKLVQDHPDRWVYRDTMALIQRNLGLLLCDLRRAPEAEQQLREAAAAYAKLAEERKDVLQHLADLGELQRSWGLRVKRLGRTEEAERAFREAVAARRKLVAARPNDAAHRSGLGASLDDVAGLLLDGGRFGEARPLLEEAIRHQSAALKADPDNPVFRQCQRIHHLKLARVLVGLRQHPEAEKAARCALEVGQKLVDDFPQSVEHCRGVIEALSILSAPLFHQGRVAESVKVTLGAMDILNKLAPEHPQDPRYAMELKICARNLSVFASRLATDPERRNPAQALTAAKKAVETAPSLASAWQALGWASYVTGAWEASIEAMEESVQLQEDPKGGDSGQWFCLAMAHCQLGHKDEARTWFDRAVQWMDKNAPKNEELGRFRAEAAALLGIDDTEAQGRKEGPMPMDQP